MFSFQLKLVAQPSTPTRHSPHHNSDIAAESPSQHSAADFNAHDDKSTVIGQHSATSSTEKHTGAQTTAAGSQQQQQQQQHQQQLLQQQQQQNEAEDQHLMRNLPWLHAVTHLSGYFSFICQHAPGKGGQCSKICIERQRRECLRLISALHTVYKPVAVTSSATHRHVNSVSAYVHNRCKGLMHAPLSVLLKSACVLDEEIWQDCMGSAWELITDADQEQSSAAACLFLLTTLKLHETAYDLIQKQLDHSDPAERINAIFRFQMMWQSRFQVWSRMENGAQTRFKLPPPNIDFVLPSPLIGMSVVPVVDAPWLPKNANLLPDVTTLHGHDSSKALVTATTTHHKQQVETLNKALLAEEKRIRSARDNYPFSTMCFNVLASAQEPALAKSSQHAQVDKEKQQGNEEVAEGLC